ncbi:sulfatase [Pseudomaricurvus alkylphenolicus]|uniref:sulfatase family protein n=1 Tax=Pseudomaricurvus alkylphenolicus TaxID=1306991 RepID=UPI00141FA72F|nr:sulfatase [Pseudomaricurvus alkylphenolicus]NIB38601.1 sulfatase [Pseudomaricurvus alkylphenolicus]
MRKTVSFLTMLSLLCWAWASTSAEGELTPKPKRLPNIVFILADDHRWDFLGAMGHPFVETPNIDRIAKEGVLFENAFVTSSLCSPSRASFLTGQYPEQHGVKNNFTPWDNANITYFEYLKQAGYHTAFIGKWHMPGAIPRLRGMDLFVTFDHMGGQGAYYNTPYIVNGKALKAGETPVPGAKVNGYITDDLTNFAMQYVEDNQDKPFALYLSHKAVHLSMQPDEEAAGRYDDQEIRLPSEADSWLALADGNFKHFLWSSLEEKIKDYAETATAMDQQIGRLMDKLDELGLAENTLLIYAADNGYMWGEHRLIDKRWAYEESMRVPFVVRYPGAGYRPGQRSSEMILNLDLAPTLLDVAGLKIPGHMQGKSVLPLLQSRESGDQKLPGEFRDAWMYRYFEDFPYPVPAQTALRTQRYKLIDYERGKRDELFDLQSDPREQHNLIDDPAHAAVQARLRQQLQLQQQQAAQTHTRQAPAAVASVE